MSAFKFNKRSGAHVVNSLDGWRSASGQIEVWKDFRGYEGVVVELDARKNSKLDTLEKTFTTIKGQTYELKFSLALRDMKFSKTSDVKVKIGNVEQTFKPTSKAFSEYKITFTGTGSDKIVFSEVKGQNDGVGALLKGIGLDVSQPPPPRPEVVPDEPEVITVDRIADFAGTANRETFVVDGVKLTEAINLQRKEWIFDSANITLGDGDTLKLTNAAFTYFENGSGGGTLYNHDWWTVAEVDNAKVVDFSESLPTHNARWFENIVSLRGDGAQTVIGSAYSDEFYVDGSTSLKELRAGAGNDTVVGVSESGASYDGGDGIDTLIIWDGDHYIDLEYGQLGHLHTITNFENVRANGTVFGTNGRNTLEGNGKLYGRGGNDSLIGQGVLDGGEGDDTLEGRFRSDDHLTGGAGSDIFVFGVVRFIRGGFGDDVITDFEQWDKLDFGRSLLGRADVTDKFDRTFQFESFGTDTLLTVTKTDLGSKSEDWTMGSILFHNVSETQLRSRLPDALIVG